ncbi:hypothetical protein MKEN_00843500 [Mycena kentingensis (nom. inval.)]|nr:hypothetical protein MKEN_00843500 [Mycena kentingensis (nom. inval.)]
MKAIENVPPPQESPQKLLSISNPSNATLPAHILAEIFTYLAPQNQTLGRSWRGRRVIESLAVLAHAHLIVLGRVCRNWLRAAETPSLWTTIEVDFSDLPTDRKRVDSVVALLKNCFARSGALPLTIHARLDTPVWFSGRPGCCGSRPRPNTSATRPSKLCLPAPTVNAPATATGIATAAVSGSFSLRSLQGHNTSAIPPYLDEYGANRVDSTSYIE